MWTHRSMMFKWLFPSLPRDKISSSSPIPQFPKCFHTHADCAQEPTQNTPLCNVWLLLGLFFSLHLFSFWLLGKHLLLEKHARSDPVFLAGHLVSSILINLKRKKVATTTGKEKSVSIYRNLLLWGCWIPFAFWLPFKAFLQWHASYICLD